MNFLPYSQNDADSVMTMLKNHIDYTPDGESGGSENQDFFSEVYVDEKYSGINYVLKDDNGIALGFMAAENRSFSNGGKCWYITALFVAKNENADSNAVEIINSFTDSIHDANELCANVHPSDVAAAAFWKKNGFAPNSDRAVFSNSDAQTLVAYWKRIER